MLWFHDLRTVCLEHLYDQVGLLVRRYPLRGEILTYPPSLIELKEYRHRRQSEYRQGPRHAPVSVFYSSSIA